MKKIFLLILILIFAVSAFGQSLNSPNGNFSFSFKLTQAGEPVYQLSYKGKTVIKESKMGFEIKDQPALTDGFQIFKTETAEKNETWNPVWGEVRSVRNNYKELAVTLQQTAAKDTNTKTTRQIVIRFRLFDDGLGFRYEFPVQNDLKYFTLTDENTEFNLTGDHKTFWIPGDYDTNENPFTHSRLSAVDERTAS